VSREREGRRVARRRTPPPRLARRTASRNSLTHPTLHPLAGKPAAEAAVAPSTRGGAGDAIPIVGYEQIEGRPHFIFRSSRGVWSDGGYGYFSFETMEDNVLLGFSVGIKRKVACAERARACGRSTPARTDAPPTVSRTRRPVPRRPARSPRERTS